MFDNLRSYKWVLDTYEYADGDLLISTLPKVIAPADRMAEELRKARGDGDAVRITLHLLNNGILIDHVSGGL